ncbi:MAG: TetR/AcrR family transcriptional regulator [Rhodobacter sp.]|nr:TetR/AcrR family transcriptional regulator [Rhodobacter sp.]
MPSAREPKTDPKKRKRLSSAERREEFIAKAIEFFAQEGFESSTRELARRLGVTQPLLYRYFPSKEDLIAEVYKVVYVNRWRDEWDAMIADRSQPIRERMTAFYHSYTDVVFRADWMRIFLFSGLKGVDINQRYLRRVRERILDPIVRECRFEAGFPDLTPSAAEIEYAWVLHGGIYYYGVRRLIYESAELDNKSFVIESSLDAFLMEIAKLRGPG